MQQPGQTMLIVGFQNIEDFELWPESRYFENFMARF